MCQWMIFQPSEVLTARFVPRSGVTSVRPSSRSTSRLHSSVQTAKVEVAWHFTDRRGIALWGFPEALISNCYGLTETAPDLTVSDPREFGVAIETDAPSIAAVGKPNALVELRVVGPDGADVANGEAGELWARGPNITKGYLNLAEETRAAFEDGWFRTGDVARIDRDGYVYLLDRLKDMIISGGENVFSAEVEAALYQHPGVHECAVIGVADQRLGETVMALIVPKPETELGSEAVADHCRQLIAGYKVPRRIAFVDVLPKNAMGKILKGELRKAFADD